MRGYKAALSNPNVSDEAKEHSQSVLNEMGGDRPREELYQSRGDQGKDPVRVSAGLKAAQRNPRVTEGGKQRASQKMQEVSSPEE
ncbi:Conidiation-specific protein 6 [Penicillium cf. griseofulvum]|nr:Conidiation-specific protein 6 [Penicillium cf. griseofulvum]